MKLWPVMVETAAWVVMVVSAVVVDWGAVEVPTIRARAGVARKVAMAEMVATAVTAAEAAAEQVVPATRCTSWVLLLPAPMCRQVRPLVLAALEWVDPVVQEVRRLVRMGKLAETAVREHKIGKPLSLSRTDLDRCGQFGGCVASCH